MIKQNNEKCGGKLFLQSWTWTMRNLADEFSQVSKGDISLWYMGGRVSEKITCPLPTGHFWVDDISFSPGGIRDPSLEGKAFGF